MAGRECLFVTQAEHCNHMCNGRSSNRLWYKGKQKYWEILGIVIWRRYWWKERPKVTIVSGPTCFQSLWNTFKLPQTVKICGDLKVFEGKLRDPADIPISSSFTSQVWLWSWLWWPHDGWWNMEAWFSVDVWRISEFWEESRRCCGDTSFLTSPS